MTLCSCGALHTNAKVAKQRAIDPSRTGIIRRRYEGAIVRRFMEFRKAVVETIVTNDAFGLAKRSLVGNVAAPRAAFAFETDAEKIRAFQRWMRKEVDDGILQVTSRDGAEITGRVEWQDAYVRSAYQKALADKYGELQKAGYLNPLEIGGASDMFGTSAAFNVPIHANTLATLYTRNFEALRGVTSAMSTAMSRSLSQSMAEGRGARQIARALTNNVDGIGIVRARMIARTETIHTYAEATLNTFQVAGVEGVNIEAEVLTAGDNRVCSVCAALSGHTFTIAEARGKLPFHVSCRCAWKAANIRVKKG